RVSWNPRYNLKLETRLPRVQVPAQVIVPERDGVLPLSIARKYSEILPQASLTTLTGTAAPTEHLLIIQEPKRLAAQIATTAGVHS
ncbi:alpha/beta fold hydrolase, partial [Bacillus subtilis]